MRNSVLTKQSQGPRQCYRWRRCAVDRDRPPAFARAAYAGRSARWEPPMMKPAARDHDAGPHWPSASGWHGCSCASAEAQRRRRHRGL